LNMLPNIVNIGLGKDVAETEMINLIAIVD
jgi:hypothetical protein